MEQRNLETLVEQFNRANEIDRLSRVATGKIYWAEVDGVATRMVDVWLKGLSPEESATFATYMAGVVDGVARALGFENAEAQFKDAGQKIFSGLKMGINTPN